MHFSRISSLDKPFCNEEVEGTKSIFLNQGEEPQGFYLFLCEHWRSSPEPLCYSSVESINVGDCLLYHIHLELEGG